MMSSRPTARGWSSPTTMLALTMHNAEHLSIPLHRAATLICGIEASNLVPVVCLRQQSIRDGLGVRELC